MKNIPNIFTLLNLFAGCIAIVFALQNGFIIDHEQQWVTLSEQLWLSSLFIGIAAVIDFLDGFVARLFRATSEMGRQLDSLADVVSFGVAPGMILYQFLRFSIAKDNTSLDATSVWLYPAFIVSCAAAWRLAKFNIDTTQQYGFRGVPTPAAGLLIASFPLIYWFTDVEAVRELLINRWFLYAVIAIVSFLMMSNIPMLSLKFRDKGMRSNLPKIILAVIAIVAALLLSWLAVPVVFISYVIVSLIFKSQTI